MNDSKDRIRNLAINVVLETWKTGEIKTSLAKLGPVTRDEVLKCILEPADDEDKIGACVIGASWGTSKPSRIATLFEHQIRGQFGDEFAEEFITLKGAYESNDEDSIDAYYDIEDEILNDLEFKSGIVTWHLFLYEGDIFAGIKDIDLDKLATNRSSRARLSEIKGSFYS